MSFFHGFFDCRAGTFLHYWHAAGPHIHGPGNALMKIYHAADIHLGRRRLDGRLPDEDFAVAFKHIVTAAVEDKADVFLLAGDLFDRPQVDPRHLGQALDSLRQLKQANIPVVAIEGNHDKAFVHSGQPTWVHHLAQEDLLILLQPRFGPDGAILEAWNKDTREGAWIELGGVRFVGAGYLGAATPSKVRQIVARMDGHASNVLLLHAGPDYFVGEGGGFSRDDLKALREKTCYLALGHIHKPMLHDNWACNPGSPENGDLNEARYGSNAQGEDQGRGYAVVKLDPNLPTPLVSVMIRSNPRRPCHRLELDCSPFGNKTKRGVEAFVDAACKLIKPLKPVPEAIIDLRLSGTLNLKRIALDPDLAARQIATETGVRAVAVDTTRLNLGTTGVPGDDSTGEGMAREDLERSALGRLLEDTHLWGLEEARPGFADLFYQLKEGVLNQQSTDQLAEQVAMSPLVEQVLQAKAEAQPGVSEEPEGSA
jgi:exonuclease SbcD